jgi:DNA topoisomerase-2
LDIIDPPKITKSKSKPYTKIIFRPDYARLGIPGLSPDMVALLKKRVYDIGAVTGKSLRVKYNGGLLPVKTFSQYVDLYIGPKESAPRAYEEDGSRWEYAVAMSPSHDFEQVSFVNGVHTPKGGKHCEYILGQITRKLAAYIEKKVKTVVNPATIKQQLIMFLRCDIDNPLFDSQTKEYMSTPSAKFGSTCTVSDKFIEKVAKMGVMEAACAIAQVKETKAAAKKTDGSKTKNIRGIPKLIDANWAGTEKSDQCTIIFCEGDSAKAGIVSGLSSDDRNTIGVYPMKGKMLNVRGEQPKKIAENKEITEIKKILGLENGKRYETMEDVKKSLRYGRVLFMTDQDLDGSHIKGLGINLFQSEWPTLAQLPGFLGFMNTPILKARKGTQEIVFYSEQEYETWKGTNETSGWKFKYYKGLGTSTGPEFRKYLAEKKLVGFQHTGQSSEDAVDMVFNKSRADDRKQWLGSYNRDAFMDTSKQTVSYEEFIHQELIHFSKYDNDRSIPNLVDGFKISLRKIFFAAKKKGLTTEIKVAQFSGYVSEHSGYHHGEASLNAAIVGMAQNYVGSNNINLFQPNGQFGSRLAGGKDSASERYIFTQLNPLAKYIFPDADDAVLDYLNDDGTPVEPTFYAPIIPMVLVNGAKGIGTGFSTEILSYNPIDIIEYISLKLKGSVTSVSPSTSFVPYYEGFLGTIQPAGDGRFLIKGSYERVGPDKIRITELPVGLWTDDFKEYLETLTEGVDKAGKKVAPLIKDYDDMSKDTTIDFVVTLQKGKLDELEAVQLDYGCNGLEKQFKLFTVVRTSNMYLFDAQDKLRKYASVTDIIDDYFETRLKMYGTRKAHLIASLQKELVLLSSKKNYIVEILEGTIDMRRKKQSEITAILVAKQYPAIDSDVDYKYLTRMPMDSVTEENVIRLMNQHKEKADELTRIQSASIEGMWLQELDELMEVYIRYREQRRRSTDEKSTKSTTSAVPKKKVVKKHVLKVVEN